jgi:Skp family chaperone for outer membrane proteins
MIFQQKWLGARIHAGEVSPWFDATVPGNIQEDYAKANGFDLAIDKASNASLLYFNSALDRTTQIIEELKK